MIGVVGKPEEATTVAEFFELFKTPWEPYRPTRRYDVILCGSGSIPDTPVRLVIVHGVETSLQDPEYHIPAGSKRSGPILTHRGMRIPIYGNCLTFPTSRFKALADEATGEPAAFVTEPGNRRILRLGFNLFDECRYLLTTGQPVANARVPALEFHFALLREFITGASIPLLEIPPVPQGHDFIACLTHDVDHAVLRNHRCDHTMLGFLYRATLGTWLDAIKGRASAKKLRQNLAAACSLPLVHLGLARDFWRDFHRYTEIEKEMRSTFFVLPYKDRPGLQKDGRGRADRAARYDIDDIRPELGKVRLAGGEVGLHGIDAWCDPTKGREELERMPPTVETGEVGVRMHWLFFDEGSPATLEAAGFSYDSTVGYNETVGYRAGTMQAYQPPGVTRLTELPLHVMDTALFYPGYLNLAAEDARRLVWGMMDDAVRFGGALTVNFHDRSIAPERLWGDFYVSMINELRRRGAWCPTAGQAVSWFRKRRSAVFECVQWRNGEVNVRVSSVPDSGLPGLRLRVHRPRDGNLRGAAAADDIERFVDVPLHTDRDCSISF